MPPLPPTAPPPSPHQLVQPVEQAEATPHFQNTQQRRELHDRPRRTHGRDGSDERRPHILRPRRRRRRQPPRHIPPPVARLAAVTPAGEEVFYVRIMSPQGETLAVESSGSGTLTNKLNGEEIRYTTSGSVQYDQKDTNVCIDYTPNAALGKGNYAIEIYNKDYMVGKGSFLLK